MPVSSGSIIRDTGAAVPVHIMYDTGAESTFISEEVLTLTSPRHPISYHVETLVGSQKVCGFIAEIRLRVANGHDYTIRALVRQGLSASPSGTLPRRFITCPRELLSRIYHPILYDDDASLIDRDDRECLLSVHDCRIQIILGVDYLNLHPVHFLDFEDEYGHLTISYSRLQKNHIILSGKRLHWTSHHLQWLILQHPPIIGEHYTSQKPHCNRYQVSPPTSQAGLAHQTRPTPPVNRVASITNPSPSSDLTTLTHHTHEGKQISTYNIKGIATCPTNKVVNLGTINTRNIHQRPLSEEVYKDDTEFKLSSYSKLNPALLTDDAWERQQTKEENDLFTSLRWLNSTCKNCNSCTECNFTIHMVPRNLKLILDNIDKRVSVVEFRGQSRWQVKLCFVGGQPPLLHSNAAYSHKRFLSTEKAVLKLGETYVEKFKQKLNTMLRQGQIEFISQTESESPCLKYHLPLSYALKSELTNTSTSIRVIFDPAYAANPPSLNDCLSAPPDAEALLINVVLQARLSPVLAQTDISNFYNQILIDPQQRDLFRFFARTKIDENGDKNFNLGDGEISECRVTSLLQGGKQSPVLAHRVRTKTAHLIKNTHPLAAYCLERMAYFDDVFLALYFNLGARMYNTGDLSDDRVREWLENEATAVEIHLRKFQLSTKLWVSPQHAELGEIVGDRALREANPELVSDLAGCPNSAEPFEHYTRDTDNNLPLPPEDQGQPASSNITDPGTSEAADKVPIGAEHSLLGYAFNLKTDEFAFNKNPTVNLSRSRKGVKSPLYNIYYGDDVLQKLGTRINKAMVLSAAHALYDPLNITLSLQTNAKLLFRRLISENRELSWKDLIPAKYYKELADLIQNILYIKTHVSVPRNLSPPYHAENLVTTLIAVSDGACGYFGSSAAQLILHNEFTINNIPVVKTGIICQVGKLNQPDCNQVVSEMTALHLSVKAVVKYHDIIHRFQFIHHTLYVIDSKTIYHMIPKPSLIWDNRLKDKLAYIQAHIDGAHQFRHIAGNLLEQGIDMATRRNPNPCLALSPSYLAGAPFNQPMADIPFTQETELRSATNLNLRDWMEPTDVVWMGTTKTGLTSLSPQAHPSPDTYGTWVDGVLLSRNSLMISKRYLSMSLLFIKKVLDKVPTCQASLGSHSLVLDKSHTHPYGPAWAKQVLANVCSRLGVENFTTPISRIRAAENVILAATYTGSRQHAEELFKQGHAFKFGCRNGVLYSLGRAGVQRPGHNDIHRPMETVFMHKRYLAAYAICMDVHKHYHNKSAALQANILRMQFHIPRSLALFQQINKSCSYCKLRAGDKPQFCTMAPLPSFRSTGQGRLSNGLCIDTTGPYLTIDRRSTRNVGGVKRYFLIACCVYSRYLYTQIINDLSAKEILLGLKAICGRSTYFDQIYADAGSAFCALAKQMEPLNTEPAEIETEENIVSSETLELERLLSNENIAFTIATPKAAWQNGAVEALIKTFKRFFKEAWPINFVGQVASLDQAAAIAAGKVNHRPICVLSQDAAPDEIYSLCPASLNGYSTTHKPDLNTELTFGQKNECMGQALQNFTKAHDTFYLQTLARLPNGWNSAGTQYQLHDVVMFLDSTHRNGNGILGRISKVNGERNLEITYRTRPGDERSRTVCRHPKSVRFILRPSDPGAQEQLARGVDVDIFSIDDFASGTGMTRANYTIKMQLLDVYGNTIPRSPNQITISALKPTQIPSIV